MSKVEDIKAVIHDIKFKYDLKIVIVLTLLVATCGCATRGIGKPGYYLDNMTVDTIGRELDKMAKGREKFGTISFSEPILVESKKDQSNPFDFTLTTGPDNYYKDARNIVQGKMASSSQFIKDTGVDLSIQGDISGLAADTAKLKQHEQKHAADQEIPTSTPAQPSNDTTPPSEDGSQSMSGFLGLLEKTPDSKISNRSAISTAAGDTVTEAIFTILGNPARTTQFKEKLMLFGVSMVSVTPGYVTKEGYTGELSVTSDYFYDIARRDLLKKIRKVEESKGDKGDKQLVKLIEMVINKEGINWEEFKASKSEQQRRATIEAIEKERLKWDQKAQRSRATIEARKKKGGKNIKSKPTKIEQQFKDKHIPQRYQRDFRDLFTPLAAAVSPMTDVDVLDLSSSVSNQTFSAMKISAALSYAGLTGQAEVFDNWARKLKQDTKTRTSYAAITSFSYGPHFGFRIRPRLKAIKDGKNPGYVLEDQSFPAAVIIGIDTDDLKLAFDFERDKDEKIKTDLNGMTRLVAYEPTIEFHQATNWLPNKKVSPWDMLWGNELTENKRLEWLDSCTKLREKTKAVKYNPDIHDPNYTLAKYINNRIILLNDQILGTYSAQYLPMEFLAGKPVKEKPTVDNPSKVFDSWYDAPSTYTIKGKNFEGQVVGANIGGQPCKFEVVGDNTTLVTFPGLPDPSRAIAQADLKIEQFNLNIIKIQTRIAEALKRINEANDILKKKPVDPAAIEKKKKANTDLVTANSEMAIAKANKKVAEKEKILAQTSKLPSGPQLHIVLITKTKEGPIPAGAVRFTHNVTPKPSIVSKSTSSSSGISKTDAMLTITRNAANKILTITSKGESKEVDKLIDIVKEGEKTGANVDLKVNASGQMDVKADTNPK